MQAKARPRFLSCGDAPPHFVSLFIRRAVIDRIEDERARPLLSHYLETAGREDFIPYEEARKDRELE